MTAVTARRAARQRRPIVQARQHVRRHKIAWYLVAVTTASLILQLVLGARLGF